MFPKNHSGVFLTELFIQKLLKNDDGFCLSDINLVHTRGCNRGLEDQGSSPSTSKFKVFSRSRVAFSKHFKGLQGWGYLKNFKGNFKLTSKNLELQGENEGNIFKVGQDQVKGWTLENFEDFSRNFKEPLKFLEIF